jgi:tRNA(Arg) A34 adenosine deaminase TadA
MRPPFTATEASLMRAALASAAEGVRLGHGGPFGACVVREGKLIATAHNTVIRDHDPTAHAEVNAVREACRTLGTHDLSNCVMICTVEPCPMCLGAIAWSRIPRVIFGTSRHAAAAAGFDDARFHCGDGLPPLAGGLLKAECAALFDEWKKLARPLY